MVINPSGTLLTSGQQFCLGLFHNPSNFFSNHNGREPAANIRETGRNVISLFEYGAVPQ